MIRVGLMRHICWDVRYLVDFPDVKTICRWIHEAGGVAILAHPGKVIVTEDIDEFKKTFQSLIKFGIDGAECYYPSHTEEITSVCLNICEQNGLIVTSGSDCHGSFEETYIGQLRTDIEKINLGKAQKLSDDLTSDSFELL